MEAKIARIAALVIALLLAAGYLFLPTLEEASIVNNGGGEKETVPTEGRLTWSWTPEMERSDLLAMTVSGRKKAKGMTVYAELTGADGAVVSSLAQPVDGIGKNDRISLKGSYEKGKVYTLSVYAEGEGTLKLLGSTDEEGNFYPMLRENGTNTGRNPVTLYFAAGVLMIALTPVSGKRKARPLPAEKKESRLSAALPWAAFFLLAALGLVMALIRPVADVGEQWRTWDEEIHWKMIQAMNLFREDGLRLTNQEMITWNPGYLPLAAGFNLAAVFTSDLKILYHAAVCFSALTYAAVCALAVRHAPEYKATFLVAGTLPIFLFQMTSATYDTVVTGSILLGLALVLETLDREETVSLPRAMTLLAVMAFGTVAKPAYSVVLCSLLLFPRARFENGMQAWGFRILAMLLLVWCLASLAMPGGYEEVRGGDARFAGADAAEQLKYMLANPVEGGLKPLRHLWETLEFQTVEAITRWGYLGVNRPLNSVYLWLLLVAAPLCTAGECGRKSILTPGRRIVLMGIAVAAEVLLVYAQYLASSEVGGGIQGMQARYFMPVWIAAALALMWPAAIRKRLGKMGDWMTVIVCLVCLGGNIYHLVTQLMELGMPG